MPRRKLLCIDLRWIASSGVGIYIQGIMPGLLAALADVDVVGIGERDTLERFVWSSAPNFRIVSSAAPRYSIKEQIELPRLIPANCNLFFSPYYTTPLLYRGPLAVTVHDMSHLVVDEIIRSTRKRMYARTMYYSLVRRASLIFTVSNFSRGELIRLTKCEPEKIIATHLGVSPEWYRAHESARPRTEPYFVAVGNIKPYKNLRRLLDAFLELKDHIPNNLVIVGQSEGLITGESSSFFECVRRAGDRVVLTGKVSYRELLALVAHAQALVMPSLYEGFGLPPLEAMATGVPVAVARAASLPEVCGDAALYFDPTDTASIRSALQAIATQPDLRAELIRTGMEQSRKFSWEETSRTTAERLRLEMSRPSNG